MKKYHGRNTLGFDNAFSTLGHNQHGLPVLAELQQHLTLFQSETVFLICYPIKIQMFGIYLFEGKLEVWSRSW